MCPELSLKQTFAVGLAELERIEKSEAKPLIANRMPIQEQGELTGAVLTRQDPISIQRVDRHLRSRANSQPHTRRYALGDPDSSACMQRVRFLAERFAATNSTACCLPAKAARARAHCPRHPHGRGDRRDMPFVAVNCAAVSETPLESELFGYEEGAYHGFAGAANVGLFEAAHKGTLSSTKLRSAPDL